MGDAHLEEAKCNADGTQRLCSCSEQKLGLRHQHHACEWQQGTSLGVGTQRRATNGGSRRAERNACCDAHQLPIPSREDPRLCWAVLPATHSGMASATPLPARSPSASGAPAATNTGARKVSTAVSPSGRYCKEGSRQQVEVEGPKEAYYGSIAPACTLLGTQLATQIMHHAPAHTCTAR